MMGVWPPNNVVKHHRSHAQVVWAAVLAGFIGYSIYFVLGLKTLRDNGPPVSITVTSESNGTYHLPDIAVCLGPRRGCGSSTVAGVEPCLEGGDGVMTLREGFNTTISAPKVIKESVNGTSCFKFMLSSAVKLGGPNEESQIRDCPGNSTACSMLRATFLIKWPLGKLESTGAYTNAADVKLYTPKSLLEPVDEDATKFGYVLNNKEFIASKIAPAAVVPFKYVGADDDLSARVEIPTSSLLITTERVVRVALESGSVGYKAAASYVTTLQSLSELQDQLPPASAPITAGDAVLQFEIVVTQLWHNLTTERNPFTLKAAYIGISSQWPNVLLLFGLIYVTVNGRGVPPERKLRPFQKEFEKVREVVANKRPSGSWFSTSGSTRSTTGLKKASTGDSATGHDYNGSSGSLAPASESDAPVRRGTVRLSSAPHVEESAV